MESKEKTTPKKMQNILYEHVLGLNSESPFRFMPNFSTPPTRFSRIFNPFEAHLNERLHLPVFSPSVFTSTTSPKTEEKFKWTIDEISRLKPADIDPSSLEQCEEQDSVTELKVQEKINTFFSEVIVPSPMNQQAVVQSLISEACVTETTERQMCDAAVQTELSLPMTLPKHVEEVLRPYFQVDCDCDNNQELYKKLFEFDEERSPESVHTSPALSIGLSPIQMSPFHSEKRNSGVFCNTPPALRECDLSPIRSMMMTSDVVARRSATRLNFSSHMSVDSIVLVPDGNNDDKSFTFDCTNVGTPPRQEISTISNNWDLEYKHVSLANDSSSDMDVSNSNTPRSKIFCSQRKKLSDSFVREDIANDIRENLFQRMVPCKRMLVKDDTDAGYQTQSVLLSEDSTWSNNVHLFASTPTKNKKRDDV